MPSFDLTTENSVLGYLKQGVYPGTANVKRLQGGFSAFVYRAQTEPLEDGAVTFIVKHVQNYAAKIHWCKLDTSRLTLEHEALTTLPDLFDYDSIDDVKLPRVLHFDEPASVLILEDLGDIPSLKTWASGTVPIAECTALGTSLGNFLAALHKLHLRHPSVLDQYATNQTARDLSAMISYGNLPKAAAGLGFHDDFISEAAAEAKREVLESRDVLTMGDFWPGNVLVSSTSDDPSRHELTVLDWELVKPGTAAFDIGQMATELYCIACFNNQDAGTALLESFLLAYKSHVEVVDVAKVAIRAGAHLVTFGPGVWRNMIGEEKLKTLVSNGVQLIKAGWERDDVALSKTMLKSLMN